MNKKRKSFDPDADLDAELNVYEPSDSDDDYDDNEKLLLEKARKSKALDDDYNEDSDEDESEEEEVLGVYSSEEEDQKREIGLKNADSDIEGMEDDKLPDPKAWGKRKRSYYHTDYVDQDYGGFEREEEEEMAMMEEKEARTLQSRLAAQLDDVDLSLGLISRDGKKKQKADEGEGIEDEDRLDYDEIKTDLSKLTKREKLALFQNESPEFFGLVNDYKDRLIFAKEKLFPVMEFIKSGHIPSNLPFARFVEVKTHLTLNYCTNLAFYLVLKKKKIRVKDHPVISRLLTYRTLLKKMDELETPNFIKQFNDVVENIKTDGNLDLFTEYPSVKQKRSNKKKLKLLSSSETNNNNNDANLMKNIKTKEITKELLLKSKEEEDEDDTNFADLISEDDITESSENEKNDIENGPPSKKLKSDKFQVDENGKRPITYEIAKNKGLTPHRKKEQRNPRVKHRNKYRKALIRRKGQVRQVQNEVSKYGGEMFGIKASVIKSRKFK